jgi:hypothetical protein
VIQFVRHCLACGRDNGPYREMPPAVPCYDCGGEVSIETIEAFVPMLGLLPEIPRHYNRSLGMTIEGREHLRAVQQEKGCEDASLKELKGAIPTNFK